MLITLVTLIDPTAHASPESMADAEGPDVEPKSLMPVSFTSRHEMTFCHAFETG